MPATDKYIDDYEFSATQIKDFIACQRSWAWKYLLGLRPPSTDSQALGTRVHSVLESYLLHDTPIDQTTLEGRIAVTGLGHLPQRTHDLKVEGKKTSGERVKFVVRGRHKWIGYKDAERKDEVWDHKTCKTFDYLPEPNDFQYDP